METIETLNEIYEAIFEMQKEAKFPNNDFGSGYRLALLHAQQLLLAGIIDANKKVHKEAQK